MAIFSHEKKFFFIHIEKNAGSSIKKYIMKNEGVNKDTDIHKQTGIINFKLNQFRGTRYFGSDATAKECIDIFGEDIWDEYFTFAFVRNPWDRMWSWYRYLIDCRVLTGNTSLRDWILNYDFRGKMRQTDYILDKNGNICFKHIGRYENLKEDFEIVCENLNFIKGELPEINRSSNRTPYYEFYDLETKDLISKLFEKEIDLLEYEF